MGYTQLSPIYCAADVKSAAQQEPIAMYTKWLVPIESPYILHLSKNNGLTPRLEKGSSTLSFIAPCLLQLELIGNK